MTGCQVAVVRPLPGAFDAHRITRTPACAVNSAGNRALQQPRRSHPHQTTQRPFRIAGRRVDQNAAHSRVFIGEVDALPQGRRAISAVERELADYSVSERMQQHELGFHILRVDFPAPGLGVDIPIHLDETLMMEGPMFGVPAVQLVTVKHQEYAFPANDDRGKPVLPFSRDKLPPLVGILRRGRKQAAVADERSGFSQLVQQGDPAEAVANNRFIGACRMTSDQEVDLWHTLLTAVPVAIDHLAGHDLILAAALQRLPSSAISRRVHAAWHEAVAGAVGRLTASTTGVEGAAVVQPGRP